MTPNKNIKWRWLHYLGAQKIKEALKAILAISSGFRI